MSRTTNLAAFAAALVLVGCGSPEFDPYASYERPVQPDAEETETVAPARLRLAVSGAPAALDATEARLKALVEAQGGTLSVVDPETLHAEFSYALGRGGPFAGRDRSRLARYEVRFKARVKSSLAPMRAVWVEGKKTTFEVGQPKSGARLVDEGLGAYRLVLEPAANPSPLTLTSTPQRQGDSWTLTGAPPVKLYEKQGKRWVRIRLSAARQKVFPAAPTRVRVFQLQGLPAGAHGLLAELLRENTREGEAVLSLSLDATQVWLNAETR